MVPLIDTNYKPDDRRSADAENDESTELPTGAAKLTMVRAMFDRIAPRYDLMNRLISLGLDVRWRRRAVRELKLSPGSLVVDIGAGTADIARELRAVGFRTVSVDLSFAMLAAARGDHGPLLQADASALPHPDAEFDGVISGFALRNFSDLSAVFSELARITRPRGRLCLLEVDTPPSTLLRAGHRLWFSRVVPRLGAVFSDASAYRYLPRSVAYLPSEEQLRALFSRVGFIDVERTILDGGIVQVITATRDGDYGVVTNVRTMPDTP